MYNEKCTYISLNLLCISTGFDLDVAKQLPWLVIIYKCIKNKNKMKKKIMKRKMKMKTKQTVKGTETKIIMINKRMKIKINEDESNSAFSFMRC